MYQNQNKTNDYLWVVGLKIIFVYSTKSIVLFCVFQIVFLTEHILIL